MKRFGMKRLFYVGIIGLILFEVANVYFIMPMPGSQRMMSIEPAYFLYTWRWAFRTVCAALILVGLWPAYLASQWGAAGALAIMLATSYAFNFRMSADHLFAQPGYLAMQPASTNHVKSEKLVVGIALNGDARAYPIQFIGYHHQVRDTVGGQPVMVTYCTVCHTGRIYTPVVDGRPEQFRLVGMDHFNAMFEDQTTGSWWRQANGEAITGPRKGDVLSELPSTQTTLRQWLLMHPNSRIMQPDTTFNERYTKMAPYETGKGASDLTRMDSLSWKDKSWVVGIAVAKAAKAYDWNRLLKEHIVNDQVGPQPVVVALARDKQSFMAFERPAALVFSLRNDTLFAGKQAWSLAGTALNGGANLKRINAYQEFWHSWQTFQEGSERY